MAIACADCGTEQNIPEIRARTVAECIRCGRVLDRADSGVRTALAWVLALFFLLLAANAVPIGQVMLGGEIRVGYISSGVVALGDENWPILALMYALFVIVFPIVRTGSLALVLTMLLTRRRPRWLGRMYRYSQNLRLWAMPDVLVLAGLVIFMRTQVQLGSQVLAGGWCLVAAACLNMLLPWLLSPHHVWRKIMPNREPPTDEAAISCDSCDLVLPLSTEDTRCPRCRHRLHLRKPDALSRTTALVLAGYILYFPAYYYPMSYSIQPSGLQAHTIISSVERLFSANFYIVGVIIFVASIMIPLVKLIGLSWLLISVKFPSTRALALRTRLHRYIHYIGRWSNTDPFIVALMAPMISFSGLADVHVGRAALPFALVVIITMLASRCFDARLMWDAAYAHL
ncbi:paraquat-inducible protein A [Salinisphaera sp. USBA-960]|nr:paraquat-inducible protein A [Salifodinibacter halophilus]NNC27170.1 paraquat-inducible protein A [Salifodinibacter halophilus]